MTILICGGAGYIGSHMVRYLRDAGESVIVLDDLSTGHRQALMDAPLVVGSLLDPMALDQIFQTCQIDAVMHFAAKAVVPESVADPALYYENNVNGTLTLLQAMRRHGVARIVFSSTCATYGVPQSQHIEESHPQSPINPYGFSKLVCERMLQDAWTAYGIRSVSLRYFNAAGAAIDGEIGEAHCPETHLIPNAIRAALGQAPALSVFGTDYPTHDGTCIRDYIHVLDLADAHARALNYLTENEGAHVFNLGTENGTSVKQVIDTVADVLHCSVPVAYLGRRSGDPPALVADSRKARTILGWTPRWSDMVTIVESAARWHRKPRYP